MIGCVKVLSIEALDYVDGDSYILLFFCVRVFGYMKNFVIYLWCEFLVMHCSTHARTHTHWQENVLFYFLAWVKKKKIIMLLISRSTQYLDAFECDRESNEGLNGIYSQNQYCCRHPASILVKVTLTD